MPMVSVVGYGECGCGANYSRPAVELLFFARPLGAGPRPARHPHGRKVPIIDWDLSPGYRLVGAAPGHSPHEAGAHQHRRRGEKIGHAAEDLRDVGLCSAALRMRSDQAFDNRIRIDRSPATSRSERSLPIARSHAISTIFPDALK
jgi:hypothetical protein